MLNFIKSIFASNKITDWPLYLTKAFVWQIRKRLGHTFTTRLDNGASIKVYPSTAYSSIFYSRHPEGHDFLFIRKHAFLSDVFVDVGSNVGLFSASLFDVYKTFICFEPSPATFAALSETCTLNQQVDCELHNIGVGNLNGELFFEKEFEFSTTSRFVAKEGPNTIRVPVETLDSVLGNRFDDLVMKIDTEGFEEKVFEGADILFSSQSVKLVMFERLGRSNLANIRNFLETRGYVVFRVKPDLSITTDEHAISEPCINLFAWPRRMDS